MIPALVVEAVRDEGEITLHNLHVSLGKALEECGGKLQDSAFAFEGWLPHISYYDERSFYFLKSLVVVEHRGGFGVDLCVSEPMPLSFTPLQNPAV